jgi:hypothetical protein
VSQSSGSASVRDLSDAELVTSIAQAGYKLWKCAMDQHATLGSIPEDPRWGSSPLPLRFELQLAILSVGALDAYDVVASLLAARASQQAFGAVRYQMESVAVIRWFVEPEDQKERQYRAYCFLCDQITRSGKFMMKDAGRDRDALSVVRSAREWGRKLQEIADQDGFPSLEAAPKRVVLWSRYMDERAKPRFDMLSELGSHPGLTGLTLFAIEPDSSNLRHDLQGGYVQRAFWIAVAIWQLWEACEAVSRGMDWTTWLSTELLPRYEARGPLIQEAIRRHRERSSAFD